MGIRGNYHSGEPLLDVYLKITRIWGSKDEGWNAWVGVFKDETAKTRLAQFHVTTPYVDGSNPYPDLYKAAEAMGFVVTPEKTAAAEEAHQKKEAEAAAKKAAALEEIRQKAIAAEEAAKKEAEATRLAEKARQKKEAELSRVAETAIEDTKVEPKKKGKTKKNSA